jgi:hypothetical protein
MRNRRGEEDERRELAQIDDETTRARLGKVVADLKADRKVEPAFDVQRPD